MAHEPLLPDDVRKLYEELIDEGIRVVESGSEAQRAALERLMAFGLGTTMRGFNPPVMLPAGPNAACAHLLLRWHLMVDDFPCGI